MLFGGIIFYKEELIWKCQLLGYSRNRHDVCISFVEALDGRVASGKKPQNCWTSVPVGTCALSPGNLSP